MYIPVPLPFALVVNPQHVDCCNGILAQVRLTTASEAPHSSMPSFDAVSRHGG